MTYLQLKFTANAGFLLRTPELYLAVDAFPYSGAMSFSGMPDGMIQKLITDGALRNLDLLFVSHRHVDHYGQENTATVLKAAPKCALIAPFQDFSQQLLLTGPSAHLNWKGSRMDFYKLTHSGEEAKAESISLYGLLLTAGHRRILIPGDCSEPDEVLKMTNGQPVDTAILNFPWVVHPKKREFVEEVLHPKHLVLCHLPFSQDDTEGYLHAAMHGISKLRTIPDVRLLTKPYQEETL